MNQVRTYYLCSFSEGLLIIAAAVAASAAAATNPYNIQGIRALIDSHGVVTRSGLFVLFYMIAVVLLVH